MVVKVSLVLVLLSTFSGTLKAYTSVHDQNYYSYDSTITASKFSDRLSFNSGSCSGISGHKCIASKKAGNSEPIMQEMLNEIGDAVIAAKPDKQTVKLHLKRRSSKQGTKPKTSVLEYAMSDLARIQTLHRRLTEKKNQNTMPKLQEGIKHPKQLYKPIVAHLAPSESLTSAFSGQLMAKLKSGASLGSGEYLMDVLVGTPPRLLSMILDTGSDLSWIQCVPCYDCFEQNGPHYNPHDSSSFKNISCQDPRCKLVSSPDPHRPCKEENQTCPYFYWYGDGSNTTGDFALETFTVKLNMPSGKQKFKRVVDVMFGCGHWNRGLFRGAAGLLGLGRGPLSFSSQLQSIYGHSFSYCLVEINSNTSISSKLIFGENRDLLNKPDLNFTSFLSGKENQDDTFYYLQIKSIIVGGEVLKISEKAWNLSSQGTSGTIIDSGTTLTFFPNPAYDSIKEAFRKEIKGLPMAENDGILDLCYNISGIGPQKTELPEFGILFADGAVWNFPTENYFYRYEAEEILCLAILETPHSAMTIIGNYMQQNFHILYDTKKSRLGYLPRRCADVQDDVDEEL